MTGSCKIYDTSTIETKARCSQEIISEEEDLSSTCQSDFWSELRYYLPGPQACLRSSGQGTSRMSHSGAFDWAAWLARYSTDTAFAASCRDTIFESGSGSSPSAKRTPRLTCFVGCSCSTALSGEECCWLSDVSKIAIHRHILS